MFDEDDNVPEEKDASERIFIPLTETEMWTLINLLAASAGTFDYVSNTAAAQGDPETAETFQARAQLARLFQARFGKLLAAKHKDVQKH